MYQNLANSYDGYVKLKEYQDVIFKETIDSLAKTNQGAISLFTGGGKSFIGLKIVLRYLATFKEKQVLWLGTLSANNNVYSSVIQNLPAYLKDRIKMKSYESIWFGDTKLPLTPDQTCLVVFDESHRSLANLALNTVIYITQNYNCARLAMSATQRRTDGRRSFDIIVPNSIWNEYDCNWAADNKIINKLNYFVANTRISSFDIHQLEEYKKLGERYQDVHDKCMEIEYMISRYSFNFSRDVYDTIKDSGLKLDGTDGARHIVFFGTVNDLELYKDAITNVFAQLYPNCTIRVWSYHSKIKKSQAQAVLDEAVNSNSKPNTVDVILSVNKGSESIHPRNIRSVLLFRNTSSYIKFTQQMGRGITLRDFCDNQSYIFDFSDGYVSLLRGNTIAYGRRDTPDRLRDIKLDTIESLTGKVQKALSTNIEVKATFATKELRELSKRLNEIRDDVLNRDKVRALRSVYDAVTKTYPADWAAMKSFENLCDLYVHGMCKKELGSVDLRYFSPVSGFNYAFRQWFRNMSQLIITEALDKESNTYKEITSMQYIAYLIDSDDISYRQLCNMDYVSKAMARLAIKNATMTPMMKCYRLLMSLKGDNFHDKISVRVCTYARHINLDISADDITLDEISKITYPEDKESYTNYSKELKVAERLRQLLSGDVIDLSKDTDKSKKSKSGSKRYLSGATDTEIAWSELQAWHIINGINHKTAYANFIRHKLVTNYRTEFKYKIFSMQTEENCKRLVHILNKWQEGDKKNFTGTLQEYLFDHINFNNLSLVEVMVLRIYGVKTNTKYNELLDMTDWMRNYSRAIAGDKQAIIKIENTNCSSIDKYRRSLLNSKELKEAKARVYDDIAPQLIIKKAKSLYTSNNETEAEIAKAISTGVVDGKTVVYAAFPDFLHSDLDKLFNTEYDTNGNWINNGNFRNIYHAALSGTSCITMVLGNILNINSIEDDVRQKASTIYDKIVAR